MRRRELLAALGAVSVAGCAAGGGQSGGTPTPRVETRVVTKTVPASPNERTVTVVKTKTRTVTRTRTVTIAVPATAKSDTPTPTPTRSVSPVQLGGTDDNQDDPKAKLTVDFNSGTAATLDSGPRQYYAPDRQKWLVAELRIKNVTGDPVELSPSAFDLDTEQATFNHAVLENTPNPLDGVTLEFGDQLRGWVPYLIPSDVTDGQLVVNQGAWDGTVSVDFSVNTSLDVSLV